MNVKSKLKKYLQKKTVVIPVTKNISCDRLLSEKVALITGGSGGIGFAIAKKYVEYGAKVIIAGRSKNKVDACCRKLGGSSVAKGVVVDITKVSSFSVVMKKATSCFGKIDILVCSHGVHTEGDRLDFLTFTENEFDRVMDVNLKGTYFFCQQFAEYVIKHKIEKSHILLISSSTSMEPSWSPYRLSKRGINGLTQGMAQVLLRYGIIVNAIAPGSTATKMLNYERGGSIATDENTNGRLVIPEEVAEYAAMMTSGLGDMIVGEVLLMSGGRGSIELR